MNWQRSNVEWCGIVVEFTTLPVVIGMESEFRWNGIGISLNLKLIYWS